MKFNEQKMHYSRSFKPSCGMSGESTKLFHYVNCLHCLKKMYKRQPDGISFEMIDKKIAEVKG